MEHKSQEVWQGEGMAGLAFIDLHIHGQYSLVFA
jgi:hypothetical protein